VVECDKEQLPGRAYQRHLVLDCHCHQVKKFVHAGLVQTHYAGMSEALKDCAKGFTRAGLLRAEYFFEEAFTEHVGDNIGHDLN